jgi:hypothetical protein
MVFAANSKNSTQSFDEPLSESLWTFDLSSFASLDLASLGFASFGFASFGFASFGFASLGFDSLVLGAGAAGIFVADNKIYVRGSAVVDECNIPALKPLALSISNLKFGSVRVWVEVVAAETGVVTRDPWRVTFQGRLPEIHTATSSPASLQWETTTRKRYRAITANPHATMLNTTGP